jgi:hypothetical protein
LLSSLGGLALSACSVMVPDVKVCAVAGRLQAGADCAYTGHDETSEMDMAATVKMLEDGAIWMSAQDYMRLKTAIESMCYKMGSACEYQKLQATVARISTLQKKH